MPPVLHRVRLPAPMLHRAFHRSETKEVRLYLYGGDDRVHVAGQGGGGPLLRIISGGGDDQVVDSSRGGRVRRAVE